VNGHFRGHVDLELVGKLGASTDFKLSDQMAAICREGKRRGLWIHAGRVNTPDRIDHMLGLGFVDSIDGSAFDKFRDTHLPWALKQVSTSPDEVTATPLQGLLDLPPASPARSSHTALTAGGVR
jgi:hypothetical protein